MLFGMVPNCDRHNDTTTKQYIVIVVVIVHDSCASVLLALPEEAKTGSKNDVSRDLCNCTCVLGKYYVEGNIFECTARA